MGLDMYLTKRRPGTEGCELLAYWRKANQIHGWFERNTTDGYIENCELYPVCLEDVRCLMADCKLVAEDHSRARDVMPTEDGFFFGDTGYDENYFAQLAETVPLLERVIERTDDADELFYHAWW